MAWPPVPTPGAAFVQNGNQPSTLVWGTSGIYSTYIVKSARYSERVEEIDIENGTGFEATVILLLKGQNVEFTVVDDLSIVPPVAGDVVNFQTPYFPGISGINVLVTETSVGNARKAEGERIITGKSYTAIDLSLNP